MNKKTTLIGIYPNLENTAICIYKPKQSKPFRKYDKDEFMITHSGVLNDQLAWLSQSVKKYKISFEEVIVVIGLRELDYIDQFKDLKKMITSFAKKKSNFATSVNETTIIDIQTAFQGKFSTIADYAKEIAASRIISGILAKRKIDIIERPYQEEDLSVFTECERPESFSFRMCQSLVLGRSMNWALGLLEENQRMFAGVPSSYPRFSNGGEYIVKRQ